MEVEERGLGHPADGVLGHLGKDGVAELVEEGGAQSSGSVWRGMCMHVCSNETLYHYDVMGGKKSTCT